MRIVYFTLFVLFSGSTVSWSQDSLGLWFPYELQEFPKVIHLGDVMPENRIAFWDETIGMIHPESREIHIIQKRVFWSSWMLDSMGDLEGISSIIYWDKIFLGIVSGCYQNPSKNSHLLSEFAPDCAMGKFIVHIPLSKAY